MSQHSFPSFGPGEFDPSTIKDYSRKNYYYGPMHSEVEINRDDFKVDTGENHVLHWPSFIHYVKGGKLQEDFDRAAEQAQEEKFQGIIADKVIIDELKDSGGEVDKILDERGARYGKFVDHASVTQYLKYVMREYGKNWKELDDDQAEALEMIAHKIGRILNGDPNYVDSWVDIAGYAQLVADRLNGKVR